MRARRPRRDLRLDGRRYHERQRSGRGQFVEAALYDCGLSLLHPHAANHLLDGRAPKRSGNAHPNIAPYDTCATGSAPIFLAVGNDGQFAKLCEVLGVAGLARDERFASNAARTANRAALKLALEDRLGAHPCNEIAHHLVRSEVPCAPIQSVPQAIAHPHTAQRDMVVRIGEDYAGVASLIKLSRTPATYRTAPPWS